MVVGHCQKTRRDHPRMGCRKIYHQVRNQVPVGRDIFEQIGHSHGYKLHLLRNKMKTTWSTKMSVYPNLLEGKELNNINQAIVSDIFYFKASEKPLYAVTCTDAYSKRLLSLHGSGNLFAEQNVKAIRYILKTRKSRELKNCIFHTDKGSQNISEAVKQLLNELGMKPSMCKLPQENAYAERIQGTIKNEYLEHTRITPENYKRRLERIMYLYNHERPHSSLNKMTPVEFEQCIRKLTPDERPKIQVFKWEHPLLTDLLVTNKKKKVTKKKKSTSTK